MNLDKKVYIDVIIPAGLKGEKIKATKRNTKGVDALGKFHPRQARKPQRMSAFEIFYFYAKAVEKG